MFKKLSLLTLFSLMPASYYYAQTTVFAYVKDQNGAALENASVDLSESTDDVRTDKIGYFQFVDVQPGHYIITVTRPSFETKTLEFDVIADERRKDLGVISLVPGGIDSGVMVVDDSAGDMDDSGSAMQPTVGLLNSGRDIFQNVAAFELGSYWFRPRGVDNRYEDVLFNGVPMSKNDDGRVDFSNWGGLNDVTRYPFEYVDNIAPSAYTFGNLGGAVYYNTRASTYRTQTSLAYSYTNRSYFHRLMLTHSTGLSKSGWAFTGSISRRWADDGVIDGTYQDNYAYFASIEKQFNSRHSLFFTGFGVPTYRASNAPNTQEVYDLMGKNYNSYWGWQDGEKRNSRIRNVFEPVFMLTDNLKLGKTSTWINTLSYQFGEDARSRLDWFHGADPNPTYYRNLPSYLYSNALNPTSAGGSTITDSEWSAIQALEDRWRNDESISQINWNNLYLANELNKVDGMGNQRGAVYTMVEDVNQDKIWNFVSHFNTRLKDNWQLNINMNYQNLRSDNFRRISDLLGANFAYNLDAFGNDQPYNLNDSNTRVYEGDRTQYSYILNRQAYKLNISSELDLAKWNLFASVFGGYNEAQRNGEYRNHFYPQNSFGKSDIKSFLEAGMKARVTYKIDGKNFIIYNGAFFNQAPTLNEIFVNPRVSDYITPNLTSQIINSNELSFVHRGQILKMRLTGYYTTMDNGIDVSRYYAEGILLGNNVTGQDAFVAEILTGINKTYKGAELGLDVKVSPTISANAVASVGNYEVTNNPRTYLSIDNAKYARGFESLGTAALKGYKISGTPQSGYSLGIRYNSPKFWWIGASANYLADIYLDYSAITRTGNFYTNPETGDIYGQGTDIYTNISSPDATPENVAELLKQRKYDNQFMLNANAGKSFLFGRYRMGVSVSVNNILNNRDYVTGGYEQARRSNFPAAYIEGQLEKQYYPLFGPKLWYGRGTQFFANVYLRF